MRAPRFWYPKNKNPLDRAAAVCLSPLSYIFQAGAKVRKAFADPYLSRVPVVCVGNAVAGGAGKTPTALAIAEMLKRAGHSPCFVTRGYGGSGELTCVDASRHSAFDVGDEALLLASSAPTWAARDRALAVQHAERQGSYIIMDDGLQNPHVTPSKSVLVIDGEVGIGNGRIIPAGPLREPFDVALEKADIVIVIGSRDRQNLTAKAKVPVFYAKLKPILPPGFPMKCRFVAFAGIARPEKFFATAPSIHPVSTLASVRWENSSAVIFGEIFQP